ncbi:hypothetical protein PO909_022683 [Leuciscus waleckii]
MRGEQGATTHSPHFIKVTYGRVSPRFELLDSLLMQGAERIVKKEQKIIEGNRGIGTSKSPFFQHKSASDGGEWMEKNTAWKNRQKKNLRAFEYLPAVILNGNVHYIWNTAPCPSS